MIDLEDVTPLDWTDDVGELADYLVRLLRSDRPIDGRLRNQIADLFDKKATSRHAARVGWRKGRPTKSANEIFRIRGIVRSFMVVHGNQKEAAVTAAAELLGISRAKVFEALSWRAGSPEK